MRKLLFAFILISSSITIYAQMPTGMMEEIVAGCRYECGAFLWKDRR
jgi:hypothetical protein